MNDLYELTRKLVARGCPEHPRLRHTWYAATLVPDPPEGGFWSLVGLKEPRSHRSGIVDADAKAIWTVWALEWLSTLRRKENPRIYKPTIEINYYEHDDDLWLKVYGIKQDPDTVIYNGQHVGEFPGVLLEAIEAATRHLEAK